MAHTRLYDTGRRALPGLPALLFLGVFFAIPVVELLLQSVRDGSGHLTMAHFTRIAGEPVYAKVIATTFGISLVTALLSVAVGYPLAYMLSQMAPSSRTRWLTWILIPFWTSYLVKTFAWILLLSRTGIIQSIATGITEGGIPWQMIPTLGAVLAGMVHSMVPLAVMSMLPIMQAINPQLARAAQTLGAGRASAVLSVFLPLSLSGAAAAGLLVFVTSLGFFIVPALLGSPKETMVAQMIISFILELYNLPFAAALSLVLLLATVIVFIVYDRLVGMSSMAGESTPGDSLAGGQFMSRLLMGIGQVFDAIRPKSGSWGLKAYCSALVALLMLPIAVVIPISFTASSFLSFPPQGFSLRWYEAFLTSPIWQAAILRSLGVGLATGLISVALGLGAAFMLMRMKGPGSKALFAFLVAPLILPRIVIAVGLFYLFSRIGLAGTDIGLVLGHTVIGIPYVVVTLVAALKLYDWRLDDAAKIMGASVITRLRTVTLPLLLPSLGAAFLFAFLTSFDELTIALFVTGGLSTTLPKQMWEDMLLAVNPTLAAVSTTLLVVIVTVVFLLSTLRRQRVAAH